MLRDLFYTLTGISAMRIDLRAEKGGRYLAMQGLVQLNTWCCGVTAAWMAMDCVRRGRHNMPFRRMYRLSDVDRRDGMDHNSMRRLLSCAGVGAETLRSFNHGVARKCIDRGCPVIVTVRHSNPEWGHYAVVYGYYTGGLYIANLKRNLLSTGAVPLDEWREISLVDRDALKCFEL